MALPARNALRLEQALPAGRMRLISSIAALLDPRDLQLLFTEHGGVADHLAG